MENRTGDVLDTQVLILALAQPLKTTANTQHFHQWMNE